MAGRAMLLEVAQPLDRFSHPQPMARRHPPHDEVALVHALEPLMAMAVEAFMHRLPYEALERLDAVPYREVDRHPRIAVERTGVDGASAVVLIAPDKSWAALGQAIHEGKIVDVVAQAPDIELGKMAGHRFKHVLFTPPRPAPAPSPGWRCTRRCVARSRPGNDGAGPAPARRRRRRTRRWCGPRSAS